MPGPFEYVKTWGRWPSMGRATRQAVGIFQFSFPDSFPGRKKVPDARKWEIWFVA